MTTTDQNGDILGLPLQEAEPRTFAVPGGPAPPRRLARGKAKDAHANAQKIVLQPDIGPKNDDPVTGTGADRFFRQHAGRAVCRIELAGAPKGKGRPRFTRAGFAFTPAATRSYEDALRYCAQEAMRGQNPKEGPLSLLVEAHLPIPASWSRKRQRLAAEGTIRPTTRPDYDNLLKTLDAFNGIVWRDDAQVVDARCVKLYSERPRLVVTVEALA